LTGAAVAHRDHAGETTALRSSLAVTAGLCIAELVGGWWTNSLALLTDAAHMFTDVGALGLTWFALWVGTRPASAQKSFGYYRAEILAAFVNGVVLCGVVAFVVVEAWRRLHAPPEVAATAMLVIAVVGLAANLVVISRLHAHQHASLNLRGAYLHVVSDLLGSVGAVAAAIVIVASGWTLADPLASVAIAVLILRSAWTLVGEAVDVLMEGVPAHVELDALQAALECVDGIAEVHDLHVWTLTTGRYALSAHAVVAVGASHDTVLDALTDVCRAGFAIDHVTIQVEGHNRRASEPEH
jgi:cobalt-zinc-cadmium efflux system protein